MFRRPVTVRFLAALSDDGFDRILEAARGR